MTSARKIRKAIKSKPVIEGAGVHLKRAFGFSEVAQFDPFLLLDDFRSDNPEHYLKGFPWHPHRGIETITYVINGMVEHSDSMGHSGVISSGDVQWMTAGSGVVHQEMPKGADGKMEGFQLWANLPADHKMIDPRYRDVRSSQIPVVHQDNGVEIRIICGQVGETKGPVQDIVIDPQYLDITVPHRTTYSHFIKHGHTALAYVIQGEALFCEEKKPFSYEMAGENYFDMQHESIVGNETAVLFEDGDHVVICTEESAVRCLLISGKPLDEPVAWRGPIVMNTHDELRVAFEEYALGTFVKHS